MVVFKGVIVAAALAAMLECPAASGAEVPRIKRVLEVGEKIQLENGDLYAVHDPGEQDMVYNWLPQQQVRFLDGGRILVNLANRQKVQVSPISGPRTPAVGRASPEGGNSGLPPAHQQLLVKLLRRLETLEDRILVLDWRLRHIENETLIRPPGR